MNTKTYAIRIFLILFCTVSLKAHSAFAQKTLVIRMGEDPRCEFVLLGAKPSSERHNIDRIWAQIQGIVDYSYHQDTGQICFTPLRVGSTKIRVYGERYDIGPNEHVKSRQKFERTFQIRVHSIKEE